MILIQILRILQLAVIIRVFISWISPSVSVSRFSYLINIIDAMIKPFRVIIPVGMGYIDLGPVFLLLILQGVERVLFHFVGGY